jgi:hypothetical protein
MIWLLEKIFNWALNSKETKRFSQSGYDVDEESGE